MEKTEYSELEKKVHEILIENKSNELKSQVDFIQSIISKPNFNEDKIPSTEEFLKRYESHNSIKNKKGGLTFMNNKIILAVAAIVLAAVGVFFSLDKSAPKQDQASSNELRVKLTFVIGDVKLKLNQTNAGKKPEIGTLLSKEHVLITGSNGNADLQFNNGSSVKIKPNTEVAIKNLSKSNDSIKEELSIAKGIIIANVNKKKQSDDFQVITPTAIAGVRGTRFLVAVEPNATNKEDITRVSVLDGSVGIYKHKDGIPTTPEPILILDSRDSGQEITRGGDFKKSPITEEDVKLIEGKEDQAETTNSTATGTVTEKSLFDKYGRLEVLSLDGGKKVTGVITDMDDNNFTVHTVDGFVKVDRKKVISHDSKQLK
jgi:hypothetical protein